MVVRILQVTFLIQTRMFLTQIRNQIGLTQISQIGLTQIRNQIPLEQIRNQILLEQIRNQILLEQIRSQIHPARNPGSSSSSSSSSSSAPASTPEQKPDATPDKNTTTEVKEDGSKVTTTVEEKEDGSKVTTVKTEGKNAFGKAVVKTEKITVDKNGNTSISETTEIKAAQKGVDVSVSVKKDGNGKVTSAKTTLTCTNQKVTISADTFSQIKEAAGTKKVKVTVKLGKNTKVSISGTDVKANTTLKVYKLDSKTGKYKVTKITVKIDKKGNIKMPKLGKGTFKVKSK